MYWFLGIGCSDQTSILLGDVIVTSEMVTLKHSKYVEIYGINEYGRGNRKYYFRNIWSANS